MTFSTSPDGRRGCCHRRGARGSASGETSFAYEREVQPRPKLGRWKSDLQGMLTLNATKAAAERPTLIRIFEELRSRGNEGSRPFSGFFHQFAINPQRTPQTSSC
jgi:hypothetical protein